MTDRDAPLLSLPDARDLRRAGAVTATATAVPLAAAEHRALARRRLLRRRRAGRGLRTGVQAALIAGWCLLPVYWMVVTSLRPLTEVYSTAPLPGRLTLDSSVAAFRPADLLLTGLVDSLAIASLVTGVVLLLALTGASAIARFRFPGRAVLTGAILAASMLPGVTLLTPLCAFFITAGITAGLTAGSIKG